MLIIDEQTAGDLLDAQQAFHAVEETFAAMARSQARNFPVVREALGHADALYGFKSGFDSAGATLGLKAGGYWPHNPEHGLTNHQSSVFLFDPDTGRPTAMVSGNHLTAMRTAAACAVSIRHLARTDADTLGIVGAGHQAVYQLRAAAAQRRFERVVAWNRTPGRLTELAAAAEALGLAFETPPLHRLGHEADVIVTITSCHEPLLMAEHVGPGTHLACMGTDTAGKQEIDPLILQQARVFTDEAAQAVGLGECQHAVDAGQLDVERIQALGDVVTGQCAGRTAAGDITVFDGTGVGLQDLSVARRVAARALEAGRGQHIHFGH